ncbi:flagellar export chaperone FliS [Spirochaeta thermophila]|uniref:Flagellar secretion chaperone FliS n=2 Tax=Winmispira thermophila TaxID=154 RepID=G0GCU0_WINT7|nr:flagellar export chaperone FliS [Spirochaeta thermophila]ADN01213.1 putative flagellar protein FliS [Spirochaeta thermophila DSM 6192]AEJ60509.1 flagellar protein FliS [Spirochaeta thermophila DSM 6578]
MKPQNAINAYKQTSIKTASQGKLIVMLYDGAIRNIDTAIELLEQGTRQLDRVHNAVIKAQDIVAELASSLDLDRGGDLAKNLLSLYLFFDEQLMEANIRKDPELLRKVRDMLASLREAWAQIAHMAPEAQV